MKLTSILAITFWAGTSLASAHAQQTATLRPAEWGYASYDKHEQHEYDSGYKDGAHSGMDDARHGRGFIMYDHGSYRDHRDLAYREGYERGYREAYRANMGFRDHLHDRY